MQKSLQKSLDAKCVNDPFAKINKIQKKDRLKPGG